MSHVVWLASKQLLLGNWLLKIGTVSDWKAEVLQETWSFNFLSGKMRHQRQNVICQSLLTCLFPACLISLAQLYHVSLYWLNISTSLFNKTLRILVPVWAKIFIYVLVFIVAYELGIYSAWGFSLKSKNYWLLHDAFL